MTTFLTISIVTILLVLTSLFTFLITHKCLTNKQKERENTHNRTTIEFIDFVLTYKNVEGFEDALNLRKDKLINLLDPK